MPPVGRRRKFKWFPTIKLYTFGKGPGQIILISIITVRVDLIDTGDAHGDEFI